MWISRIGLSTLTVKSGLTSNPELLEDISMKRPSGGATYLLALSLFSLAGALLYFAISLTHLSQKVPEILSAVERVGEDLNPAILEIERIRDTVPAMLEEVAEIRKQIPPILEAVRLIETQIPPILEEVRATRAQLPQALDSLDRASAAAAQVANELKSTRPFIPKILTEMEKTRTAVPPMLDQAAKVIGQARQKAAERTVTGVITGVISAPFSIIGNIGKKLVESVKGDGTAFTEKDIELLNGTISDILATDRANASGEWQNQASGHFGKVTLVSADTKGPQECRTLHIQAWKGTRPILAKEVVLCIDGDGNWRETK